MSSDSDSEFDDDDVGAARDGVDVDDAESDYSKPISSRRRDLVSLFGDVASEVGFCLCLFVVLCFSVLFVCVF